MFFVLSYPFLAASGQDRRTKKEQRERGEAEPGVWDDPKAKSIFDSVAAPSLPYGYHQFRKKLIG